MALSCRVIYMAISSATMAACVDHVAIEAVDQASSVEPAETVVGVHAHLPVDLVLGPQPAIVRVDHQARTVESVTACRSMVVGLLHQKLPPFGATPGQFTLSPGGTLLVADADRDQGRRTIASGD